MEPKKTDSEVIEELKEDIKKIKSAFIKDDDNEPDYSGHKYFHKKEHDSSQEMKRKRSEVTTNIITWAIMALITIIVSLIAHGQIDLNNVLGK